MAGGNFSRAFDLSSLRAAPPSQGKAAPSGARSGPAGPAARTATAGQPLAASTAGQPAANGHVAGAFALDVTEATFEAEVLNRSMTVPVVVDFWAEWCQPCKALSPILERLSDEFAGRFVLARVDVDANQQLATAANVQSIPLVLGILRGQAVPLFQGAVPEPQARQVIEELLRISAANGVGGRAAPLHTGPQAAQAAAPEAVPEPAEPEDPRFDEAFDAFERGDFAAAAEVYRQVLRDTPADPDARAGLAQAELLLRLDGRDPAAVRAAAEAAPMDVDAQCLAADADLLDNRVDEAFARLVAMVRKTSGQDRDRVRVHLLELFGLLGDDPRVLPARRDLASALF